MPRWRFTRSPSTSGTEPILRALQRPPEPLAVRAALRWRHVGEAWHGWLRRSPDAVDLVARWGAAAEYRELLGDDAFQEQLVGVLSRAGRRDCAAAGFGCTRRMDRECRGPEICAQDPGELRSEGPAPGACDTYYGDDAAIVVRFSPGDRHRAVFLREPGSLWVDGVRVGADQHISWYGRWLDDRWLVAQAEGPDDHPLWTYERQILNVIVHDAEERVTLVLTPGPEDAWTNPWPERDGDGWKVRAEGRA
ncbi:hypothetical protein ACTI_53710 [Actinoplanes sp. OR16]|uniref:hypothetical protein n=1 Tax=Actinoplanes sp. OR16 TaxID=946334 RepID=UPI000F6C2A7F|nr:hypothetical protein [Actinoplanes sp. OR16]BBH68686.1 hypothetical protein ACTI_53710 [Actinoplanes sp. OR16]